MAQLSSHLLFICLGILKLTCSVKADKWSILYLNANYGNSGCQELSLFRLLFVFSDIKSSFFTNSTNNSATTWKNLLHYLFHGKKVPLFNHLICSMKALYYVSDSSKNKNKSFLFPPQRRDMLLSSPVQQYIPSVHLITVQTQNKVA